MLLEAILRVRVREIGQAVGEREYAKAVLISNKGLDLEMEKVLLPV